MATEPKPAPSIIIKMKAVPLTDTALSAIRKNILATLAYFDLFDYPLTIDEVFLYLPGKCDLEEFEYALRGLLIDRLIYKLDQFYTLKNDYLLIERRIRGNNQAAALIGAARKVSDRLIRIPYVRGIAISGALSKKFAADDADIALFVITAKNRLWIARTLVHGFKKITSRVNKQRCFCTNYYVDEQALQIREKNIYTATEIATLIPLHGDTVFEHFYNANAWTMHYLPNKCMRLSTARAVKSGLLKRTLEMLCNNRAGNLLDGMLMNMTAKKWWKNKPVKTQNKHDIGISADKHCAKPDPKNFQNRLLMKYARKLTQLLVHSSNGLQQ